MASNCAYLPLVSSPVATKRYTSPTRVMVRPSPGLWIVGFIWLSLLSLCWQLSHELHRSLNPALQLVVVLDALRLDHHPIPHRPAGDVERSDVRLPQRHFPLVRANADDQAVLPDPRQGIAVEEEAHAAEHLLLLDVLLAGQSLADAVG